MNRGTPQALLVLENRLIRGAFSTDRLDAVKLIAGQLAVSLDNAQLYADYRRIADEQAALRRVATLVARGAPPGEVFAAVTDEVARLLDVDHVNMSRYDPDGVATVVGAWSRTGGRAAGRQPDAPRRAQREHAGVRDRPAGADRPLRRGRLGPIADLVRPFDIRSVVGVPISVEGRLWGVVTVSSTRRGVAAGDTEARLAGFTELVATAIANAESQAQLTASRARIVAAADQTRRRIERDLHDGAQQRLVSLALRLRVAQAARTTRGRASWRLSWTRWSPRPPAPWTSCASWPAASTRRSSPRAGWLPALKVLARRSAVPVELDVRVARPVAGADRGRRLLRGRRGADQRRQARPGLDRHGHRRYRHPPTVPTCCVVEVRDDGRGGAELALGTGLLGLKDRVEALGGAITVESPRGQGTTLRVTLPITGVWPSSSQPDAPTCRPAEPEDHATGPEIVRVSSDAQTHQVGQTNAARLPGTATPGVRPAPVIVAPPSPRSATPDSRALREPPSITIWCDR